MGLWCWVGVAGACLVFGCRVLLAVVSDILVLSGIAGDRGRFSGSISLAVIVVGSLWSGTAGGRIRLSGVAVIGFGFQCCTSIAIRNMAVHGCVWNA